MNLVVAQDEVAEVDQALQVLALDDSQAVSVHVQGAESPEAHKGVRCDLANGIA